MSYHTPANPARYYGLDALRASMMLLGIALHAMLPYAFDSPGYYSSPERSDTLSLIGLLTHHFRMPLFFFLSGFFSGLLQERRGTREFVRNRLQKVGLVWIVSLGILTPIVYLVNEYNHFAMQGGAAWRHTMEAVLSWSAQTAWLHEAPLHLWFLEYLMLFCLFGAGLVSVLQARLLTLDRWAGHVFNSRWRCVWLSFPTVASLSQMPSAIVPYPASFCPWFGITLIHGWFYLAGWLLYRRRDLLPVIERSALAEKLAVPILIVVNVGLLAGNQNASRLQPRFADAAIAVSAGLLTWCMVFALLSAALRFASCPRPLLPWLADFSYWAYLAHFPIALLLPALLRNVPIPPVVKVALIVAITLSVLLLAYEKLIRYTCIGTALNGRRVRKPKTLTVAA